MITDIMERINTSLATAQMVVCINAQLVGGQIAALSGDTGILNLNIIQSEVVDIVDELLDLTTLETAALRECVALTYAAHLELDEPDKAMPTVLDLAQTMYNEIREMVRLGCCLCMITHADESCPVV